MAEATCGKALTRIRYHQSLSIEDELEECGKITTSTADHYPHLIRLDPLLDAITDNLDYGLGQTRRLTHKRARSSSSDDGSSQAPNNGASIDVGDPDAPAPDFEIHRQKRTRVFNGYEELADDRNATVPSRQAAPRGSEYGQNPPEDGRTLLSSYTCGYTSDDVPSLAPASEALAALTSPQSTKIALITSTCVSCDGTLSQENSVKMPCKHLSCKDCFVSSFGRRAQVSTTGSAECCSIPIPLTTVACNLPMDLFSRYLACQNLFNKPPTPIDTKQEVELLAAPTHSQSPPIDKKPQNEIPAKPAPTPPADCTHEKLSKKMAYDDSVVIRLHPTDVSAMDNQSAQLIIALQLRDLAQLEESGGLNKTVIEHQRRQLERDSLFDNVAFESSRRLAVSMAKAINEDSTILARTITLPPVDDATFYRLAALNQPPPPSATPIHSAPGLSQTISPNSIRAVQAALPRGNPHQHEAAPRLNGKRPRSAETSVESCSRKKLRRHAHNNAANECDTCPDTGQTSVPVDVLTPTERKASLAAVDQVPPKAECASCACEDVEQLIKASCEHHYCRDCFENFIGATLETPDGFPPCCCKVPLAFNVVADNVSSTLFHRYQSRQEEIRNATALYCGVLGCGVRINSDKVDGLRATCVACMRRTCTQCRGEMPRELKDKHICKKDPAREAVIALAKQEGWQACYKCGTMVSLNFGCHHMTCHCKAEFCYKCGTPWKTCDCGDYDEPRILVRATRGVGVRAARRVARNLPPDPRSREEQLVDLQQRLQGDCDHSSFTWRAHTRERPGRSDICEYEGWKFILPCENCPFTSCRECHNYHDWTEGKSWGSDLDFDNLRRQLDEEEPETETEDED